MRLRSLFLSVGLGGWACLATTAGAAPPAGSTGASSAAARPATSSRLQEVFKSLEASTRGEPIDVPWKPLLIGGAGVAMGVVAIKQWNRRQTRPAVQALHNHRKLLREASRAAGVPAGPLKAIQPLTQRQGVSSPLVAILCPSTIQSLAQSATTAEQEEAIRSLTRTLLRKEGRSDG